MPFGSVRTDVGIISQTDLGYTFQRNLPDTGLMDYKARFYDPYITQFSQPDSIIPDLYNPQALNRYAYALNNPVKFVDPSGHKPIIDNDENGNPIVDPFWRPSKRHNEENDDDESLPVVFQPFGLNSDYYSLSVYHGFLGRLIGLGIVAAGWVEPSPAEEIGAVGLASLINAGVTFSIDKYGRLYISPGVSIGVNSIEPLPTVTLTSGNLMTGEYKGLPTMDGGTPTDIEKLLSEFSTTHGASYAFFPNVGTTRSPAAPYNSIEFGWGFPGHINFAAFSYGFGPIPIIK
jgi:RHS repeat-associated protein